MSCKRPTGSLTRNKWRGSQPQDYFKQSFLQNCCNFFCVCVCVERCSACLESTTADTFMQMPSSFPGCPSAGYIHSWCPPSHTSPLLPSACLGHRLPLRINISYEVLHSPYFLAARASSQRRFVTQEGSAWFGRQTGVMPRAWYCHLCACVQGPGCGGPEQLHRFKVASFHHESTNKGNCQLRTLLNNVFLFL